MSQGIWAQRASRSAIIVAVLSLCACIAGCKTTETTTRPANGHDHIASAMATRDVKLNDLANPAAGGAGARSSTDTPVPPADAAPGDSVAASPGVPQPEAPTVVDTPRRVVQQRWLRIEKQLYPRVNPKLKLAMSMLNDPAELDQQLIDRWSANGLHVGVVDANRLPLFRANLQRPMTKFYRMPMHNDYTPLTLVHRIDGVQQVQFAGADGSDEPIKLISGEWQLLVKLMPPLSADDDTLWLDILPHHYGPQPTILPKRPDQRLLDGRSFSDLRIAHRIKPGEVWMIWAEIPQPESDDKSDSAEASADSALAPGEAEVSKDKDADAKRTKPPLRLGEAMLTGRRGTQPVQLVLMIYLEESTR